MLLKIAQRGVMKKLTRLQIRCLRFNFEHGHFTPYGISLQQAESLAKWPLTLEKAQFITML